jgi:hypothetical protein
MRHRMLAIGSKRTWACSTIAALLLTLAGAVHAGEEAAPPDLDPSAALFREARFLLNKGRFAEACEKFRASLALKRAAGTLLNVANCQEGDGDWAGALASVEAALGLAVREPDQRKSSAWMAAARDEIAALEPRIARVVVHVEGAVAPAVTLDGAPLVELDAPLRLNPGPHTLEAAAPHRKPFLRELELVAGQTESVVIPELTLDAPPSAVGEAAPLVARDEAAPATTTLPSTAEPSTAVPWALVGVGGAVFVGGAITGLVAVERTSELESDCPDKACEGDLSARDRAETTAHVADVLMAAGLVTGGIGVVLLLTGESPPATPVALGCGPGSCAIDWRGTF